jgi:hypothetical protein
LLKKRKKRLRVWLKWQGIDIACVRPCVQPPVRQKKKEKKQNKTKPGLLGNTTTTSRTGAGKE